MDIRSVGDDEIRAAKERWLAARPYGERDGPEHAHLLALVQAQARRVAAEFRAEAAGRAARRDTPPAG